MTDSISEGSVQWKLSKKIRSFIAQTGSMEICSNRDSAHHNLIYLSDQTTLVSHYLWIIDRIQEELTPISLEITTMLTRLRNDRDFVALQVGADELDGLTKSKKSLLLAKKLRDDFPDFPQWEQLELELMIVVRHIQSKLVYLHKSESILRLSFKQYEAKVLAGAVPRGAKVNGRPVLPSFDI